MSGNARVAIAMRDGRDFVGPVWNFQPKLGWIAIVDERAPERIFLRNIESAILAVESIRGVIWVDDVLAKARELGWDGT